IGTSAGEALNEGDNPAALVKNTVLGLPEAAYQTLVPQFIQHIISGNFQQAASAIENDPVGQIAPLVLLGRQAADAAGVGDQFDSAVSTAAKPVTSTAGAATSKVSGGIGNLAAQLAGMATGAGASSVKEAFNGTQAFVDAMRGKIDPESVVQTAQDAVQNIADNRRQQYLTQLGQLGQNTQSLDISPVLNAVQTQLQNFGVKVNDDGSLDFSRSSVANNGSARADIQGVYETLKSWGSQPGDRTAVGLDTLKKQLGDFYSQSGSARAFVQAVKTRVSGILNTQVPGYQDMTQGYQKATGLLDDIRSATGAGGNSKVDTVFTKLTTAMKGDKDLRLQVLQQMQAQGAQPDLMGQIAGINMKSYVPRGLVGKGTDIGAAFAIIGHFFQPQYIPMLLATSPRVVGEFVRTLGMTSAKTSAVMNAIN